MADHDVTLGPPPIPKGMDAFAVRRDDDSETYAVSKADAAKLAGISPMQIAQWVKAGKISTCERFGVEMVLVDSLWAALPPELKA